MEQLRKPSDTLGLDNLDGMLGIGPYPHVITIQLAPCHVHYAVAKYRSMQRSTYTGQPRRQQSRCIVAAPLPCCTLGCQKNAFCRCPTLTRAPSSMRHQAPSAPADAIQAVTRTTYNVPPKSHSRFRRNVAAPMHARLTLRTGARSGLR